MKLDVDYANSLKLNVVNYAGIRIIFDSHLLKLKLTWTIICGKIKYSTYMLPILLLLMLLLGYITLTPML